MEMLRAEPRRIKNTDRLRMKEELRAKDIVHDSMKWATESGEGREGSQCAAEQDLSDEKAMKEYKARPLPLRNVLSRT